MVWRDWCGRLRRKPESGSSKPEAGSGNWKPAAGSWQPATGYWLLATGYWLLAHELSKRRAYTPAASKAFG